MQFERDFVKAGGLLLAGCDPTSFGGVLPGFGDQRGIELLVDAGFTPVEAIHIATQNGAIFWGESDSIGSIAAGKAADLVVLSGNPAQSIEDIEKVQLVFKDGMAFDPAKLIQSVQGMVGQRLADIAHRRTLPRNCLPLTNRPGIPRNSAPGTSRSPFIVVAGSRRSARIPRRLANL